MVKSTKNICRVLFFSGVLLVTSACSDSFLLYVSDKTKKSGRIFAYYSCFCLSLRQI